MVNYQCDHCGVFFDTPTAIHHGEWDDGRIRMYSEHVCPICGCDSFQEATTCPQCQQPMPIEYPLCSVCRNSLKARIVAFADELTAEEEPQLDEWMDGDTITNRRKWK